MDMINSKTESSNVVVTDRDIELFRYLNEQNYMVSSQIYQIFWPDSNPRSGTARQRLSKLIEVGLVKTKDIIIPICKRLRLFMLTAKGIDLLQARHLSYGFEEIHYVNPLTVKHSLKLTNVRALFRELGQTNWRSERLIRTREAARGWFPDAILDVRGLQIAIELDNSFKSKERYERRFEYYKKDKDFTLALFVFSWDSVGDWLYDMEVPQNKVCFVHYDDLFKKKGDVELYNATSRILLRNILK